MPRCRDFTKRAIIIQFKRVLTACEMCCHHSDRYNDCKIHGTNNSTSVVHGEVKR